MRFSLHSVPLPEFILLLTMEASDAVTKRTTVVLVLSRLWSIKTIHPTMPRVIKTIRLPSKSFVKKFSFRNKACPIMIDDMSR